MSKCQCRNCQIRLENRVRKDWQRKQQGLYVEAIRPENQGAQSRNILRELIQDRQAASK